MFDHEKLDVYRVSIQFVGWTYQLCKGLKGIDRNARDQILRASQSIPLNIAEGNGKLPSPDRQRFFRIALGSALESAAVIDVLAVCEAISITNAEEGKKLLYRIVSMLTKLVIITTNVNEENSSENEYLMNNEYPE
jgi:four helix bundle protein